MRIEMKKNVNSKKKNVNSRSLKNLKPFEKGHKNATGRPKLTEEEKKERSIQKYLESANSNLVKSLIESGEYESLLKQALLNTIEAGKIDGFKFLNDYNGNKPKDTVEHTGNVEVDVYQKLSKDELKKELDKLGLADKLFDK